MDTSVKNNAVLAWVFAPIPGFVWRDEKDPFLQNHARESLYLGVFNIITIIALTVLSICSTLAFAFIDVFGFLLSCLWGLIWLLVFASVVVPRLIGIIKALNGETWEIPYVSEWMRKFIKL